VELGVTQLRFWVVAQPLRRAETLAIFWFLCGPFAARGATGEAEYPSRWLGGTGERSPVGKRKRQGVRDAAWSSGHLRKRARGNGMNLCF
jgi:hypothetical protein